MFFLRLKGGLHRTPCGMPSRQGFSLLPTSRSLYAGRSNILTRCQLSNISDFIKQYSKKHSDHSTQVDYPPASDYNPEICNKRVNRFMDTPQENISFFAAAAPIELLTNIYNKLPSTNLASNVLNKAHRKTAIMVLFSRSDPESLLRQDNLLKQWKNFNNFPWIKDDAFTHSIKNYLSKQIQNSRTTASYKLSAILFILTANGTRPKKTLIEKLTRELMGDTHFLKKPPLPLLYTLFYALPLKENSSTVNMFIEMTLDNNNETSHFAACEALSVLPSRSICEKSALVENLLIALNDNSPQKVRTTKPEIACRTITGLASIFLINEKSPILKKLIELTERNDNAGLHACYALEALSPYLALTEQSSLVKEYVLNFENWKKKFSAPNYAWEALEALCFGLSPTRQSSIALNLLKILLKERDKSALRGRFILARLSTALSHVHKAMMQQEIRTAMQHEKTVTRFIACVTLGYLARSLSLSERSRTMEILLEKFHDGEVTVRHAAREALNTIIRLSIFNHDRQLILKHVLAGLNDLDAEIRMISCQALLCFSSLSPDEQFLVLPTLVSMGLHDDCRSVKYRAVIVINKFCTFTPASGLTEQSCLIKQVASGLKRTDTDTPPKEIKTEDRLEAYKVLIALAPLLNTIKESLIIQEIDKDLDDAIFANSAISAVVALSPHLDLHTESPILFRLLTLATKRHGKHQRQAAKALATLLTPLPCPKESILVGELIYHLQQANTRAAIEPICRILGKLSGFITLKINGSLIRSLFTNLKDLLDYPVPLISAATLGKLFPLFSLQEQNALLPKILKIMLNSETPVIGSKFLSNLSLSMADHNPEVLDLLVSALKKGNKPGIRINACNILNALAHSFTALPLDLITTLLNDKTLFQHAGLELISTLLLSGKIPPNALIPVRQIQDRPWQYILLDALMICHEKYVASAPELSDRSRFFQGYTCSKGSQTVCNDIVSSPR